MNKDAYIRPDKPATVTVTRRRFDIDLKSLESTNIVKVSAKTECHVTQPRIADQMAKLLNLRDGASVLDPQAGTGNLSAACIEQGFNIDLMAIELNAMLFNVTSYRLIRSAAAVINGCCLEYAATTERRFDRIISNPPFSKVKQHINASYGLLAKEGQLVALVPVTFEDPRAEHLISLDNNCFALANVYTKIIRFIRE